MVQKRELLGDILAFYADLYQEPDEVLDAYLRESRFQDDLAASIEAFTPMDVDVEIPEGLVELKKMYDELFVSTDTVAVPLAESFYKPWTMDQEIELPFAHSKGYLSGDSAWHMKEILARLLISSPDELNASPDHLSVILQVAASLAEHHELFDTFARSHLDWLDDLLERMMELQSDSFYIQMTKLLRELIRSVLHDNDVKEATTC